MPGTQATRFMIHRHDASDVEQQILILIHHLILWSPHLEPGLPRVRHHGTAEHHPQPVLEQAFEIMLVEEHDFHGTGFIMNRHRKQGHIPSSRPAELGVMDGSGNRGFLAGDQLRDGHDARAVFIPPR